MNGLDDGHDGSIDDDIGGRQIVEKFEVSWRVHAVDSPNNLIALLHSDVVGVRRVVRLPFYAKAIADFNVGLTITTKVAEEGERVA